MTSFADSEIDKIPGAIMDDNLVIIETVHCWTPLLSFPTTPSMPRLRPRSLI
jgi:hypothetical protein